MDFMKTVTALAVENYPQVYKGHQIDPVQGGSLVPALEGK